MSRPILLLSLIVGITLAPVAHASQFNMRVSGDTIHHDSYINEGSVYKPSLWDIPFSVPTTNKWSPKLPVETSTTVVLSSGNVTHEIDFTLLGFEFHLGSSSQSPLDEQTSGSCQSGSVISLVRGKCDSQNAVYQISQEQAAFTLVRPVISFDQQSIKRSFATKPDGVYSGNVLLEATFDYYWGDVRARRLLPISLEFVVVNETDGVTSIDIVSGDGKFFNRFKEDKVSGDTNYRLSVAGKFSSGIKLSLATGRSSYQMKKLVGDGEIPYSVECNVCQDNILVEDGSVKNSSVKIPSNLANRIDLTLNFSFENINIASISSGEYHDNFYLYVEHEL